MMTLLVGAAGVLLACLALLHVYWAFGGSWGKGAVLPVPQSGAKPLFQPGRLGTLLVAALLFAGALVLLARIGAAAPWLEPQAFLPHWGSGGIGLAFLARAVGDGKYVGLFKRVKDTRFALWDTRLFTPLCLFISAAAWLAFGLPGR